MNNRSLGFLVVASGLLALAGLVTTGADAQERVTQERVTFDGRAGVAVPAGRLADAADPGFTFGLGGAYWVNPRVALTADGDLELLRGQRIAGIRGPDLNLWHYSAGAAVNLLPADSRLRMLANVGAGASTFDPEVEEAEALTRFTTNGGLRLAYRIADRSDVFVGSQAYLMFTDEARQGSDTHWSIPVHAGLRLRV